MAKSRDKNKKNRNSLIAGIIVLVVASFYIGFQYAKFTGADTRNFYIPAEGENTVLNADFSLFWDAIRTVKGKHLRSDEIVDQNLLYGAIKGVVNSLEDPYTNFFTPEDAKVFEEDISGSFGGVGIEIGIRRDRLVIISPLKGTPGDRAGLKSGDHIVKVDDTFTNNLTLNEVVKIIRGEPGTEVVLTILREEWEEPREISVIREVIEITTLEWEMLDDRIAYIQLYSFNANAPELFFKASFEAMLRGPRGLILDLRNNSGGFLDASINIAGWFLQRGEVVVQEKFQSGRTREFSANGNGAWKDIPVVVLVNEGSASAAEILAGALRDRAGAVLVGEKTFGKGTVQEIETLKDGSQIKITIAEWLTPNGDVIDEVGLEPDVAVEMDEGDMEEGEDSQFEKALEIVRERSRNVESIPTIVF